jgi:hypothetical protein
VKLPTKWKLTRFGILTSSKQQLVAKLKAVSFLSALLVLTSYLLNVLIKSNQFYSPSSMYIK